MFSTQWKKNSVNGTKSKLFPLYSLHEKFSPKMYFFHLIIYLDNTYLTDNVAFLGAYPTITIFKIPLSARSEKSIMEKVVDS